MDIDARKSQADTKWSFLEEAIPPRFPNHADVCSQIACVGAFQQAERPPLFFAPPAPPRQVQRLSFHSQTHPQWDRHLNLAPSDSHEIRKWEDLFPEQTDQRDLLDHTVDLEVLGHRRDTAASLEDSLPSNPQ